MLRLISCVDQTRYPLVHLSATEYYDRYSDNVDLRCTLLL